MKYLRFFLHKFMINCYFNYFFGLLNIIMANDKNITNITIKVDIINIILDDSVPFFKTFNNTTLSNNWLIIIATIGNSIDNIIFIADFLFILTINEIIAQNTIIVENTVAV